MNFSTRKKILLIALIFTIGIFTQAFKVMHEGDEPPKRNLKVLSKSLSDDQIHIIMRGYTKSLGVRCSFCHVVKPPASEGGKSTMDFQADDKEEKLIARKMITMVGKINKKYIHQIGKGQFEEITCVTCHMGRPKPIISTDSLVIKK